MADKKDILEEREMWDVELVEGNSFASPIEERLHIEKESIQTASILVSKKVFEERKQERVPVTEEEVTVERKEFNEYIDVAPLPVRQEGDVTIVSVVKEVLVVEKRLMLVEELHITKHKKETVVPVDEILKEEIVAVSQAGIGTNFEPLW